MAPSGNKKKKKPAANPARGFATQSVASKPKVAKSEQSEEVSSNTLSKDDTGNPASTASPAVPNDVQVQQPSNGIKDTQELHELSPEDLERRLEEADLQNLIEKVSAKVSRDASRQVAKLQTDCRLLRGQAQSLPTRQYLPNNLIAAFLNLAAEEVRQGRLFIDDDAQVCRLPGEEDLTARLWTIHRILIGLGFRQGMVHDALDWLLNHPPAMEVDAAVWGLEECLDWLTLNALEEDLPRIDGATGRPISEKPVGDQPDTPHNDDSVIVPNTATHHRLQSEPFIEDAQPSQEDLTSPEDDIDVSDLDSDIEPEQLMSTYLASKAKLFEAQPESVQPSQKNIKAKKDGQVTEKLRNKQTSRGISKLQQKLQKIESDVLFDQREADARWMDQRNDLLKMQAGRKRLRASSPSTPNPSAAPKDDVGEVITTRVENGAGQMAHPDDVAARSEVDYYDNGDLGNLFGPVAIGSGSDNVQVPSNVSDDTSSGVTIRDFGHSKGVDPRRVLEEACRARDPGTKLTYKLVSSAAFANRQSITVRWTKDQDIALPLDLLQVSSHQSSKQSTFTMHTIATPEAHQSLAYISVYALFQIFSTSAKEEKAYLRLPPAWRDLWTEFSNKARAAVKATDRDTVLSLRNLIRSIPDPDSDEDVVHTGNFQNRLTSANEKASQSHILTSPDHDEEAALRTLWQSKTLIPAYQKMLQSRSLLPMWSFKNDLIQAVDRNQVTIICGETGCGKSTQMPAFIMEQELSRGRRCKIYCTEPRRISAITLAQRVSEELGEPKRDVGTVRSLVGYAIRLESKVSSSTRLVFATTGIVLRMLESPNGFADVTHIIIDEVHERSIETDFLLIILRSLILKRPLLKVVLMSATVDAQRFASYFYGAPILTVPGRTFPVETKFLEDALEVTGHSVNEDNQCVNEEDEDIDIGNDQSATSTTLQNYSPRTRKSLSKYDHYRIDYALIVKLIEYVASSQQQNKFGKAILVFLPGLAEIRRMHDMLSGTWVTQRYQIHSLHSSIASEDQQQAFAFPPRGLGKIVLSTNIAETGVTIPDITCVIDTGKHKEMRFDERRQISRLIESFVSRANAKQRRGRAGRVQEGLCFHLFTKARHDELMADQQTPEMLRLSLQDLIMRVKICKLGEIQKTLADALDPPSSKNVRRAIDSLIEVGALTSAEDLTVLGQQLAKLPLDPYLGKLILHGSIFGCMDISLTLAAILTSKAPFVAPVGARKQADLARLAFKKGDSDLLTEYNAYAAWRRVCTSNNAGMGEVQFCRKNMLSPQNLSNIEDLKAQLMSSLADAGFVSLSQEDRGAVGRVQNVGPGRARRFVGIPVSLDCKSDNTDLVSAVIAWSLYPKLLTRDGKGWKNVATNQAITIHPTSVLRVGGGAMLNANFLSFYSILQSSAGARNYNANSLTPVAPLMLVLLAGNAGFHPMAHVVTVDGARMRFAVDTPPLRDRGRLGPVKGAVGDDAEATGGGTIGVWKTYIVLKYLRRRLEEVVRRRWKKPDQALPKRLERWMGLFDELTMEWKVRSERKETA